MPIAREYTGKKKEKEYETYSYVPSKGKVEVTINIPSSVKASLLSKLSQGPCSAIPKV